MVNIPSIVIILRKQYIHIFLVLAVAEVVHCNRSVETGVSISLQHETPRLFTKASY